MTTMLALRAEGSAWSSLLMASCSVVRSFSSSVRACTPSTVCPGSAASASSVMRLLVCVTICCSASRCAAVSGSVLLSATRAANVTNCRATWSASRCARSGVSAVPEILMMFPSAVFALTWSRSSLLPTPVQWSASAAASTTTELVAISCWVSSSRSSQAPGSRTDAEAV